MCCRVLGEVVDLDIWFYHCNDWPYIKGQQHWRLSSLSWKVGSIAKDWLQRSSQLSCQLKWNTYIMNLKSKCWFTSLSLALMPFCFFFYLIVTRFAEKFLINRFPYNGTNRFATTTFVWHIVQGWPLWLVQDLPLKIYCVLFLIQFLKIINNNYVFLKLMVLRQLKFGQLYAWIQHTVYYMELIIEQASHSCYAF